VFNVELKSIECEIRKVTEDTRILLRNSKRGQNVKTIQGQFFSDALSSYQISLTNVRRSIINVQT